MHISKMTSWQATVYLVWTDRLSTNCYQCSICWVCCLFCKSVYNFIYCSVCFNRLDTAKLLCKKTLRWKNKMSKYGIDYEWSFTTKDNILVSYVWFKVPATVSTAWDISEMVQHLSFEGHRALLIFPLAAMLTFCQIIRKLDLRIYYFNTITAVMSLICWSNSVKKAYLRLKCMHVYCPSILTKLSTLLCIRRVM